MVALVTAMHNAVVPVQRLLAAWVACVAFVVSKAVAPVASQAASAGSKVAWITVPIFSPAAWGTTLVTHLTAGLFSQALHQRK